MLHSRCQLERLNEAIDRNDVMRMHSPPTSYIAYDILKLGLVFSDCRLRRLRLCRMALAVTRVFQTSENTESSDPRIGGTCLWFDLRFQLARHYSMLT